jgi:hypothetical protein
MHADSRASTIYPVPPFTSLVSEATNCSPKSLPNDEFRESLRGSSSHRACNFSARVPANTSDYIRVRRVVSMGFSPCTYACQPRVAGRARQLDIALGGPQGQASLGSPSPRIGRNSNPYSTRRRRDGRRSELVSVSLVISQLLVIPQAVAKGRVLSGLVTLSHTGDKRRRGRGQRERVGERGFEPPTPCL